MGKTESAHLSLIWAGSANYGGGAESERLASIYNFEQSARTARDRLKYVHVNCDFHNKRKLCQIMFEGTVMDRILGGDFLYAS